MADEPLGADARQRLVESHLRLLPWLARRYRGQGMPFEDLIQEGAIGLIRAAEKYDPARGTQFSTYATWWIRHAITRALANKGRAIRLPVHLVANLQRVQRVETTLTVELGRAPTTTEIAAAAGLPLPRVERALLAAEVTTSLDRPVDHNGHTLGELLADAESLQAFEEVEAA